MCLEKLKFLSIYTPKYLFKADQFIEEFKILSFGASMELLWEKSMAYILEGLMVTLH